MSIYQIKKIIIKSDLNKKIYFFYLIMILFNPGDVQSWFCDVKDDVSLHSVSDLYAVL